MNFSPETQGGPGTSALAVALFALGWLSILVAAFAALSFFSGSDSSGLIVAASALACGLLILALGSIINGIRSLDFHLQRNNMLMESVTNPAKTIADQAAPDSEKHTPHT